MGGKGEYEKEGQVRRKRSQHIVLDDHGPLVFGNKCTYVSHFCTKVTFPTATFLSFSCFGSKHPRPSGFMPASDMFLYSVWEHEHMFIMSRCLKDTKVIVKKHRWYGNDRMW